MLKKIIQRFNNRPQILSKRIDNSIQQATALPNQFCSDTLASAIFDAVQDAIFVIHNGIIIECNIQSLNVFGCKRTHLIGKKLHLLSPKKQRNGKSSRAEAEERIKSALYGTPQLFQWTHKKCDGLLFDAEVSLSSCLYSDKRILIAVVRELSSRNDSKIALAKSEAKYRALVDNANEAILVAQNNIIKFCNTRTEQLVESSQEEIIEKSIEHFLFPDDKQKVLENHKKRMRGEKLAEFYNFRIVTKKGAPRWVRLTATLIEWENRPATLNFLTDITAEKAAEQARIESEKKFRLTFDNASDAIYLLEATPEGPIIREANSAALQSHGYTRDELIGRQASMLAAHPRRSNISGIAQKIQKQGHVRYEAIDVRKDGKTFPVEISARMVNMNDAHYILSIERDISERKKIEQKMREQNDLLTATLESTADGILVAVNENQVVRTNNKFLEMWKVPPHLATTKDKIQINEYVLNQIINPETLAKRLPEIESSGVESLDTVALKDGRVFERYSSPMKLGGVIKGRVICYRDISLRINAENKIKELNAQLQLQMQRMPVGLIVFDTNFLITSWNPAAEQIFGYGKEEMIGTHPYDSIIPTDATEEMKKRWQSLLDGRPQSEVLNENLTKDKKRILCQWTNAPLKDEQGNLHGVLSMAFDVTEKKNTEAELAQYQMHLEELVKERTAELELKSEKMKLAQKAMRYLVEDANEARKQIEETNELLSESNRQLESFAYSVSHDLRAPLRAISGFAGKLGRLYKNVLDAEGQRILKVINDSTIKMGQLIEDLLTFSRISRTLVNSSNVDMTGLAQSIIAELRAAYPSLNIEFDLEPLDAALGDPRLLRQALFNLLENAVKYSSQKATPHISIKMITNNGEKSYCIKDNGVGFDMKYADKLYQVFQRLHTENEFKGTGVGLAITQLIIHRHNGHIWANAKPNDGASFYFTLPAVKEKKV